MAHDCSDGVSSFHFDFYKNISCPKLSCNESYYSSKLTTYAFGVHSGETRKGTVYVWPECFAPKHTDTLLYCLDFHLTVKEEENRAWNIFWADNTRSQNKNYTVVMYFQHLVSSGIRKRDDFKFLIAGHSFGEVDRDAGRAEGIFRKESTIETPADYVNIINNSSLSPKSEWVQMKQDQFKHFSEWLRSKYVERRKDVNNQPFLFSEMVHFNFGIGERADPGDGIIKTYHHPGIVWMRRTLDPREEPIEMNLEKTQGESILNLRTLKPLNTELYHTSSKKTERLVRFT